MADLSSLMSGPVGAAPNSPFAQQQAQQPVQIPNNRIKSAIKKKKGIGKKVIGK